MFTYFRQALTLLNRRERKGVYVVLVTSALAAVMQTLSILSVMPFIVVLTNPELLETNDLLIRTYKMLGVGSYHEFLAFFGILAIVILTLGNLFVALEQWLSLRFLCFLGQQVQKRVLQRILEQPYEYIVANHSAKLSDIVLRQVERVMDGVIGTFVSIFSGMTLAALIVLTLLIISLKTTLVTLIALLIAYLAVFLMLKRRIEADGEEFTDVSASIFTAVKESLEGAKEIKTRRAEAFFGRRFDEPSLRMANLAVHHGVATFLPHYLLETAVFTGFIAVALFFLFTTSDAGVSLSYIALYGMAVYRLVPALKGVFEGMSTFHHNADAVQAVLEHYRDVPPAVATRKLPASQGEIKLERVSFRYARSEHSQLSDIEFSIPIGSSVCLFGPSGSGKTTILNLLAGLLYPQDGRVLCDGIVIGPETVDSWREKIGYSPQQVYLFAATLASNIAFGVEDSAIDQKQVIEVGKMVNLHRFVTTQLPQDYQSVIAEHGDTLSGGQRQRVGIARALYHDPEVLLFDESFANLDAENRTIILDRLFELQGRTLIFSSHETAVASRCDKIVVIEQGKLIAEGRYQELLRESPRFVELLSRLDLEQPEHAE